MVHCQLFCHTPIFAWLDFQDVLVATLDIPHVSTSNVFEAICFEVIIAHVPQIDVEVFRELRVQAPRSGTTPTVGGVNTPDAFDQHRDKGKPRTTSPTHLEPLGKGMTIHAQPPRTTNGAANDRQWEGKVIGANVLGVLLLVGNMVPCIQGEG